MNWMYPILFSIGAWPISSFGLFLTISLFLGSFFVWRISKIYDLDQEKIIDLILLTFFGGLIFARIYFVLFHQDFFQAATETGKLSFLDKLIRTVSINRFPGLSFWGAIIGGVSTLYLFTKRFKLNFWQVSDFGMVGLMIGLSFSSLGCFLGACQPGMVSNWPIAVSQVGLVGKRFPLQLIEALIFLIGAIVIWRMVVKFHFSGKIVSLGLIYTGFFKFILEFWRGDQLVLRAPWALGHVFSLALFLAGVSIFYRESKRSFSSDLKLLLGIIISSQTRVLVLSKLARQWYNLKVSLSSSFIKFLRSLKRKLNLRQNPKEF